MSLEHNTVISNTVQPGQMAPVELSLVPVSGWEEVAVSISCPDDPCSWVLDKLRRSGTGHWAWGMSLSQCGKRCRFCAQARHPDRWLPSV